MLFLTLALTFFSFCLIAARDLPFIVGVNFDNYEVDTGSAAADANASTREASELPGIPAEPCKFCPNHRQF